MLIDKIKRDQITARKLKVAPAIKALTPIISAYTTLAKDQKVDDNDVVSIIKQHLKGLTVLHDAYVKDRRDTGPIVAEMNILRTYLPVQLTEQELTEIIKSKREFGINVGKYMQFLNQNYANCFDNKMAVRIIRGR